MFGCNNFCSYCIVPYVRGRERSRRSEDIIREIENLAADGVVEVMLLGQNVNSYGKGLDESITFAGLLQRVEKIDGIKRIRFMTSHPKDLSDELIDVMASSEKICRHIHLPLQSGSTKLLRSMNRQYTKEQYIDLALKIRERIPDIAITTDLIIGYPGETEEDIEDTLDVIDKVRFDGAFTFIYSKRSGTPAASMPDQVPEEVAKKYFARVLDKVQQMSCEMAARIEGTVCDVLVEETNRQDPKLVTGRLSNNLTVHFPGDSALIGRIVPVKLTECKGFYYLGERLWESIMIMNR
jgi:tRNA-2-methylthio-N6-dimethylallyladenosine synthase